LTLFFFVVQVVTGILLSLNYVPTPEQAHESVQTIIRLAPYGWMIRSIHSWCANLLVASLFVHMFSVFLMKAYRKPRELLWVTGVILTFLVLGFAFTGYLLPWDTTAYFATLIGTEVPRSLPIVGDWGVGLLKGGEEIGASTLSRMYSIHTIILPLTALFMVSFHVLLNQILGTSVPPGTRIKEPPIPFFPNFLYRDFISWILGFVCLIGLATMVPASLGQQANALASAPLGIKPEWYFLPLYQTLRLVPASIFSVSGELLVNLSVMVASAFWAFVPFIDRRSSHEEKSPIFTTIGVLVIVYLVVTIVLAYVTPQAGTT
jgi:cytochrome b6